MLIKALSLCFVKLERLLFVVRGVWMSAWGDGVLLSAVDSSLLPGSVIVNSLLEHESDCREFTKFCGVFIRRNESPSDVILFTKMFCLTSSFNISPIVTLSMLEASVLDRYS